MKKVIGIFGVPRSGTSWLGQIFNSSPETRFAFQPISTEVFRDKINVRNSGEEMWSYLQEIYESQEDFLTQQDQKEKGKRFEFNKERNRPDTFVFKEAMYLYLIPHFLRKISDMKIVLLLRNPYDVLRSWYNAPKEFYPEWDIREEWLFAQRKNWFLPERYYGYHRWKESILLANQMSKEFPDRVYIIRYEDLDADPFKYAEDLYNFCELKWQNQTKKFIQESRSRTETDPYSIYRNPLERKDMLRELPEEIIEKIRRDLVMFDDVKNWYDVKKKE